MTRPSEEKASCARSSKKTARLEKVRKTEDKENKSEAVATSKWSENPGLESSWQI